MWLCLQRSCGTAVNFTLPRAFKGGLCDQHVSKRLRRTGRVSSGIDDRSEVSPCGSGGGTVRSCGTVANKSAGATRELCHLGDPAERRARCPRGRWGDIHTESQVVLGLAGATSMSCHETRERARRSAVTGLRNSPDPFMFTEHPVRVAESVDAGNLKTTPLLVNSICHLRLAFWASRASTKSGQLQKSHTGENRRNLSMILRHRAETVY